MAETKRRGRPKKVQINNEAVEEAMIEEPQTEIEEKEEETFEPQQDFENQDKYEGTKGNYNPYDKDVFEREYATPKVAEGLTDDIPEPDFNSNPSFEDLMNETKEEEEEQPSPFDNPNPAVNDLPPKEKQFATEQMVDTVLDIYESLHLILQKFVQFSEDELNEMIINDEVDPNTIIPTEGGEMSLQEFVVSYNEQAKEVMSYDKSFGEKVRPAMVRVFMKKGWSMTDEQVLLFAVGQEVLTKTTSFIGIKKSMSMTIGMIKDAHLENKKQKKSEPRETQRDFQAERDFEFQRQESRVQNAESMNIVNEQDLNDFETEKTTFQTFERPEETVHPKLIQEEIDKAYEEAEEKNKKEE
tara:strand:- start:16451 stop:17518 length:1068 start_codon:yes stop_codon:yes gene_type:complete